MYNTECQAFVTQCSLSMRFGYFFELYSSNFASGNAEIQVRLTEACDSFGAWAVYDRPPVSPAN